MRIIFGLVFLVGVGLAAFAIQLTRNYIATYQAELAAEKANSAEIIQTEEIFVALEPLGYGDAILPEMVQKVKWPVNSMPEGVFLTDEELFPEGPEVPRIALRSMEAFEPLLAVKVTEPGEDAGGCFAPEIGDAGICHSCRCFNRGVGFSATGRPGRRLLDRSPAQWQERCDQTYPAGYLVGRD